MYSYDTTRFEGPTQAALRIVAGAMFACHGMQKILGLLGATSLPAVGSQLWVGGIIELLGGTLIALGLFTRVAAFLASGTMAVAYIQFHWKLQLDHNKWLPIINKGELAVLYCFVFLMIAVRGGGLASLDRVLQRRRGPLARRR
jgi:putative oxidoreductase